MSMRFNIILLIVLVVINDITVDIITPAFPISRNYFSANYEQIEMSFSINLIGFAVSALFYGYIADIYGRKFAIFSGLIIFTIGTLICVLSVNIECFIIARFIQGIGQGSAEIVAFSAVRTFYTGSQSAKVFSTIQIFIALSPAFAPFIGGCLVFYYSWKIIFIILALISITMMVLFACFFDEKLSKKNIKKSISISVFLQSYRNILYNRRFIFYLSIMICHFAWLWNAIAIIPFIFIEQYGLTSIEMGITTIIYALFYMIGSFLNHQLLNKFDRREILSFMLFIPVINSIFIIITNSICLPHPYALEFIMFSEPIALACILSNLISESLDAVDNSNTAKATAVIVFMKLVAGAIAISLFSFLVTKVSFNSMMATTLLSSTISVIIFLFGRKKY